MGDPASALGLREDADGYGAPPRRWSQPWSAGPTTALTAAGALLVGFLLTAGLTAGRDVAAVQDSRRAELIELINARQEHVDAQAAQLDELRSRMAEVEDSAAVAPGLQRELTRVEAAVGATAVRGPGVRVTLADAAGSCPTGREEDCRIQDTDLQLSVNALFAVGAEAIAVNGERLIATSAIRSAGQSILVNYRVLVSPYVIEAIGDPDGLGAGFATSSVAEEFEIWSEVYGLGFGVEPVDELELPAYGGSVRLRSVDLDDVAAGGGT
jgi:uncharacterized protein YlxW (UPF0749 family)